MNWMTYGIIIIFAAFIVLMIINPNLSCFGKKIASPLYPLTRQKKQRHRRIKTESYGFNLNDADEKGPSIKRKTGDEELFLDQFKQKKIRTKDYGFRLTDESETQEGEQVEQDNKGEG
ncbi:hypothetical protein ACFLT2_01610 [Acidobacteriota bacterium]